MMATKQDLSPPPSDASGVRATGWSVGIEDTEGLSNVLDRIEGGLSAAAERRLREHLGLSLSEMARLLDTSPRTLGRRKNEGRLTSSESDRLFRYARLFERAVEVLGSEEAARAWMKSEQLRLGRRVPLEVARFEPGAREVEDLLGRIERGLPA